MTTDLQTIINQMTLEEKVALYTAAMIWCYADYNPVPDYAKFERDPDEFYKTPMPFLLDFYRQYVEGIVPS